MKLGAIIAGVVTAAGAAVAGIFGKRAFDDARAREEVRAKVASGGSINLRLTGYWPFTAKAGEKQMEGGVNDRKGKPLRTVEDFFAGKSDFVSLSGDDAAWPYGQKVVFPWVDGRQVVGRVVDTGSHFRGVGKVYREDGFEPIDVCVASSATKVPKEVTAQIIAGDHFDKPGVLVATNLFKGQTVTVGGDLDMMGAEDLVCEEVTTEPEEA